ncbi:hypothetical protein GCM10023335_44490 [Streptomyces siamensis]|uniref:Uncharacterized protein n=1 Tax=Streptomyces siamensis TaxID=1274986 RepID=A0ABP9J4C7_9ACTN
MEAVDQVVEGAGSFGESGDRVLVGDVQRDDFRCPGQTLRRALHLPGVRTGKDRFGAGRGRHLG